MTDRERLYAWLDDTAWVDDDDVPLDEVLAVCKRARKVVAERRRDDAKWLKDLTETVAKNGPEAVRRIQETDGGLL